MIPRIESSIGKEVESFIVQTKKALRMIRSFEDKYNKNDFDLFIIEEGNKILNRANESLNALDEDEYLKIIIRSMNNYDICLGRVDEGSLKKDGLTISIRTTRYISYNMVEHDCYNYIKRLKQLSNKYDDSFEVPPELIITVENQVKLIEKVIFKYMSLLFIIFSVIGIVSEVIKCI